LISRFDLDSDLKQALKKSESKWTVESYRIAVESYRHAESKEHKREMQRLINEIKTNFRSEISQNDPKVKRLNNLEGQLYDLTNHKQLFELSKKEKEDWNKKVKKLSEQTQKLEKEIEDIKNNKIYENAFEWRFEFPEVLNDDGDFIGFDAVIGNPPYGVKAQQNEKGYFKDNYQGIIGKYDSYGFFIEKGINVLNNNGQFGYIIPHTWLTVLEAQKIRDFLLSNCIIIEINQLPAKVFEDATVETTNLFLQKIKTSSDYSVKVLQYDLNSKINQIEDTISERKIPINIWKTNGVFNLKIGEHENTILEKLYSNSVRLHEICDLSVGIQAYDKYAGQKSEIIENRAYHSDTKKDDTFVKELNGKEVGRYQNKLVW
ncbi:MAG: Eco57I restriction-modification methylase domain-containing protein, partial [Candidatus Kapaibacterium sp.]